MASFISKAIIPLLFASPSAHSFVGLGSGRGSITTSLRSAVEKSISVADIVELSKNTYKDLEKGCYIKEVSPTISFQYIRPPSERASSSDDASFLVATSRGVEGSTTNALITEGLTAEEAEAVRLQRIEEADDCLFEKIQGTHDTSKPILIYLPGLDGVGISAVQQYDDLSNAFELWRMRVDPRDDRSTFSELTTIVSNFIRDVAMKQNRKVILVGESFGGLLAPSVAMRMESIAGGKEASPIIGLVMVNPATSFDKTNWAALAPILASLRHIEQEELGTSRPSLPTPYSVIGGMALAATVPDPNQFQKILDIVTKTKPDDLQSVIESMRDGFGILADNLPAEVIEHRINKWVMVGSNVVNPRLHKLATPTLFIGGDEDNMLPTKEEGDRLLNLMPDCTTIAVKDTGHFILDDRFNLTSAIIDAPFDPFNKKINEKKYDPITDWKVPTDDEIREAVDSRVKPLRDIFSPKFFSTGSDGKRKLGLGKVPKTEGPLLFVANHQLIGLDLGMIIAELLEKRNIAARGLAHPIVFQAGNGFQGGAGPTGPPQQITKRNKDGPVVDDPGRAGDFQTFGAVMVTPKNFYRLMSTGQTGLLFPGGVREVFHGKGEDYELFWPEKTDFVRVAARFNATIVPISAVGAADSANILLDAEELLNLPFGLGDRLRNSSDSTISARFDKDNAYERFVPPLVVPSIPARHYFVFGKPFDTSAFDHNEKSSMSTLYSDVKSELRRGLDDVIAAREKDPYKDFVQRQAIERLSGKPAPTFAIEELNKNI